MGKKCVMYKRVQTYMYTVKYVKVLSVECMKKYSYCFLIHLMLYIILINIRQDGNTITFQI